MDAFNEYIVKVASRCNLNCSYCYEYNLGDDSWRRQPPFMSEGTCRVVAERIREHSVAHQVGTVFVNLHGGEPLLAGPERIDRFATIIRDTAGDAFRVTLGVQTNGVQLDDRMCEVLSRHGFEVSVSLDGGRVANDRHRLDHAGRSSYDATVRGIRRLQERIPGQPGGLLAVIDVANDPIEVFDSVASLGIQNIDFLLPHHNWDRPPPRPRGSPHEYGEWYLRVFDAWIAGRHPSVDVRFLRHIVLQFAGAVSNFEVMNLAPVRLVTITTDGDIEAVDCLKSTASGLQRIGLNVRAAALDLALAEQIIAVRQSGIEQLCGTCRSCTRVRQCAGGYFPHRFSLKDLFQNPSVYCTDLYWLLDRIEERLLAIVEKSRVGLRSRVSS
jgi:uncharacterized protein